MDDELKFTRNEIFKKLNKALQKTKSDNAYRKTRHAIHKYFDVCHYGPIDEVLDDLYVHFHRELDGL